MDLASKIKLIKEDVRKVDEEASVITKRISELKTLIEDKAKKEAKLQELRKQEAALLDSLN